MEFEGNTHLSIVRQQEEPVPQDKIIDFEQRKEKEDIALLRNMQATLIHVGMTILEELPLDQQVVIWGLLSLQTEEEIAQRIGLSLDEIQELRNSAEQTIGCLLPF